MSCPDCGKEFGSPHGVAVHRTRWCGKASRDGFGRVERASRVPNSPELVASEKYEAREGSVVSVDGVDVAARRPPAKNDRNNAERFAGLPWTKYPADVASCEEALDRLAVAIEHADRSIPFLLSIRAQVTELRERLAASPLPVVA